MQPLLHQQQYNEDGEIIKNTSEDADGNSQKNIPTSIAFNLLENDAYVDINVDP